MKTIYFDDYEGFAIHVAEVFDELDTIYTDVSVIAKYDEIKEIFKELVCLGYNVSNVDLHDPNWENYKNEYLLFLTKSGLYVEKFMEDGEYLCVGGEITFISNNCNSAIVSHISSNIVEAFEIGEDEDEECECCNCSCCNKDENYVSCYVNGEKVSVNEYVKHYEHFLEIFDKIWDDLK